jgi:glycosyltransferase involved in cell wall biosynthesis
MRQATRDKVAGGGVPVCIVQPGASEVSETFLRAHAEHLPARVTVVHGLPPHVAGRPVLSPSWPARLCRRLGRLLSGRTWEDELTHAFTLALRIARPAVVLAEYGPTGAALREPCARVGVPLVVHFHGYDATERAILEKYAERYRALFRDAAAIVAVSRTMRRQLIDLGAPPEKVHCNPCGVDCQAFRGGDPAAAPPVFLAVGRLVDKKGPDLTLRAFAEVYRACCPAARLRLVGDGPLAGRCRELAGALGVGDAVTFLGARPPAVVREEMRRARAFVQHSVRAPSGDCEGTPVGILEAGATGLPVVATRHGGIPDVVVEGETGLLVEERDVAGMAAAMRRLAEEPALAGALGRAARRRVEAQFTLEHSVGALWAILEACLAGRGVTRFPEGCPLESRL